MISIENKFIFIHVPKTAGNSIPDALRNFCDDEIVINNRRQDGVERFGIKNKRYTNLVKHSRMAAYHEALGSQINDYFIFTTIRNPFDKLVSLYFSPHRGAVVWSEKSFAKLVKTTPTLEDYLTIHRGSIFQRSFGKELVARRLRFEHISDDFDSLCAHLNIEGVHLKHRNKAVYRMDYRDCYTSKLKRFVEKKHRYEIQLGSYVF